MIVNLMFQTKADQVAEFMKVLIECSNLEKQQLFSEQKTSISECSSGLQWVHLYDVDMERINGVLGQNGYNDFFKEFIKKHQLFTFSPI